MSLLGKKVQLTGLSQKGKNRVREHGTQWVVLAETLTVLFAPGEIGPWLFIAPQPWSPGIGQDNKASRWVRVEGDKDFTVTPQE